MHCGPMPPPRLVLGPLLRHVDRTRATVWVECDRPCEVVVRAGDVEARRRTFSVDGCAYALVLLEGLPPAAELAYEVTLDDVVVWPEAGSDLPPSVLRTAGSDGPTRVLLGSCRTSAPHSRRYQGGGLLGPGRGVDALRALAASLAQADGTTAAPAVPRPDLLLLLGDQVYADENLSPAMAGRIRERRDTSRPPGVQVADLEEYRLLYRDSWSEPLVRWLLSTVPSAMVFDDHEVIDDWNTSASWLAEVRDTDWWQPRITGAMASYWLYQHLGNLSPEELECDAVWQDVLASADEGRDAWPLLRAFASRAAVEVGGTEEPAGPAARWSYRRDLSDGVRLLVVDSRAGRVLTPGARRMLDDVEQEWVHEQATGDVDHLLVASSLPVLMAEAAHHLETWDEAVADGAWGEAWASRAERVRRGVDLEHWAAFRTSFEDLVSHLSEVARGRRGEAPSTVLLLSGDVHFGSLSSARPREGEAFRSRVWQAVSSPVRNPLDLPVRVAQRLSSSPVVTALLSRAARLAGVPPPAWRWQVRHGPWFGNQVMTLVLDGREAGAEVHTAHLRRDGRTALRREASVRLA